MAQTTVNLLIHYRAAKISSICFTLHAISYVHTLPHTHTFNSISKMDRPLIFMIFLFFFIIQKVRNAILKCTLHYTAGIILLRHSCGYARKKVNLKRRKRKKEIERGRFRPLNTFISIWPFLNKIKMLCFFFARRNANAAQDRAREKERERTEMKMGN